VTLPSLLQVAAKEHSGSDGSFAWKAQAFGSRDTARAMSGKSVETVRRVYEGVNARLEVPRDLFDPDYEFDNTELWPDVAGVLGFDAAQETMREYWETFDA
jgi:hypothetical protein